MNSEQLFAIKYLTRNDVQRPVSINNHMASSKPCTPHHFFFFSSSFFFCWAHLKITAVDCCTLYNSPPVELKQQDGGGVCTWKWQPKVCVCGAVCCWWVSLCVFPVPFTDGRGAPQVSGDQAKDMKQGWPVSHRKTAEELRDCGIRATIDN